MSYSATSGSNNNPYQKRVNLDRGHDLNLRRLRGQLVDVSFRIVIGEDDDKDNFREFQAHRVIVSLFSPFLHALVSPKATASFFAESGSDVIDLRGIDPDCFGIILDYLYTGTIVLTQANVYGIVEVCQYLQLDDDFLLGECVNFLAVKVSKCSLEELLKIWNVAEQFDLSDLKSAVHEALAYRLDSFMGQVFHFLGYEEVRGVLDHPGLCLNNEMSLFEGVLEWCKRNVDENDETSVLMGIDLISRVKLSVLRPDYVNKSLSSFFAKSSSVQKSLKDRTSSHVRQCSSCFFVFQYGRDGSDILGIEEFVNRRKEEPVFAVFEPGKPAESCLYTVPSLTQSKSYFQHYGPHSTTRSHFVCADTLLVALGGLRLSLRERSLSEEVKYFDFETCSWQHAGGQLPAELVEFGSVYHGSELYVVGGLTDQYCSRNQSRVTTDYWSVAMYVSTQLYRINPRGPRGTTWTTLAEMPTPRAHFTVERVGGMMFVVGDGFCDVYDIENDAWKTLEGLPAKGFGRNPGLAAVGTSLFVLANRPSQGVNGCYCLDVTSLRWREVPGPNLRQDVISAFSHNNLVYVVGWQKSWRNMIMSYDPVKETWTEIARHIKGTIRQGTLVRRQMVDKNFFVGSRKIETNKSSLLS